MVYGEEISFQTKGYSDIKDVTNTVQGIIKKSGITEGIACIAVIGSTASVSTIEYEPALVADVQDQLERMVSRTMHSRHSATWGDDNGFSHIRATLMGPGITLPVSGSRVVLGTWQQIVVIDHDNRPRNRRVFVRVMGE
jgi:secondary thiamine-phosphate synthase enzyme